MGKDFVKRGFTSGSVSFAVEFDKVIQNSQANTIIEDMHKQTNNAAPAGRDRLLEQDNEESAQHVLVPESITIAQYLNREFQRQDVMNQRMVAAKTSESELNMINEYSVLELMKDDEGKMIQSII